MSDHGDFIKKEIDAFASKMSEHCESIRIIVTYNEDNSTALDTTGRGNWYAQKGSVVDWLKRHDNYELAHEIGETVNSEDDE